MRLLATLQTTSPLGASSNSVWFRIDQRILSHDPTKTKLCHVYLNGKRLSDKDHTTTLDPPYWPYWESELVGPGYSVLTVTFDPTTLHWGSSLTTSDDIIVDIFEEE